MPDLPRASAKALIRQYLYTQAHGICVLCNAPMDFADVAVDHIVPLAAGGPDIFENLQAVHSRCNSGKGDGVPLILPPSITTWFAAHADKRPKLDRTCERCQRSFSGTQRARFCSTNCRVKAHQAHRRTPAP